MKKLLSVLLVLVMVLSLGAAALASGEASADASGEASAEASGEAGSSASGEASGGASGESTFSKIEEQAGVVVKDGSVSFAEGWDPEAAGEITATGAKGVVVSANEANGFAITMAEETDVYVIEDCDIYADAGQKNAEAGLGGGCGVGVGIRTGELWIKNSRIATEGSQATAVFMESTAKPSATSLVVVDSEISTHSDKADAFIPPFKLLFGASRAIMLMPRNNSWFINSSVTSSNWGAYSQDSIDAYSYLINSYGAATEGGYAAYLTYGLKLYASQLYGAQYGVFMAGDSIIETGGAADALADADAMSKTPDYVPAEQPTVIAAPFNVIVVHTSTPGLGRVAIGNFKGALLSTMPEDLPDTVTPMAADDEFFMDPDEDSYGVSSGAAYFYNRNLYGSLILIRSMNTDFTFDDTDARSSNGVLVQTVINYDPPDNVGYLSAGQGEDYPGVSVTFKNGEYKGDILHQDYQRTMTVTIGEDGVLEGAIVSGTWQGWNDLWSEEALLEVLKADGYEEVPFASEDWADIVRENLTLADDAAYADTENLGADVTVSAGGAWIVTGASTLSTLTLADGAVLTAPEGMTLTVYVDADASNANSSYEGGTPLDELAPGTYNNVIITVSEASGEPSAESSGEASEGFGGMG